MKSHDALRDLHAVISTLRTEGQVLAVSSCRTCVDCAGKCLMVFSCALTHVSFGFEARQKAHSRIILCPGRTRAQLTIFLERTPNI